MYTGSLVLHAFGNDTSSGSQPPYATYTLQALPLGAYCNPANGGTSCGTATLHNGAPLTGTGTAMGSAMGSGPAGFILGPGDLRRTTSGSLPPYPGASYTFTTANLWNARGDFSAGGGPGSFSFIPALAAGQTRAVVVAGPNQFGGQMEVLGKLGTRNAGSTPGGAWYGAFSDWGLEVAGAAYAATRMVAGTVTFFSPTSTFVSNAIVTGFPWTTGRVSVSAAGDWGFPTKLARSGYDNRTPSGAGTIQMVTPRLTHWASGAHWGDIAVLRLQFAPEPEGWVLLAAGLSLVAVLHHSGAGRTRRHRKSSTR